MIPILAHHELFLVANAGAVALVGATATRFWHRWYRIRRRWKQRRQPPTVEPGS
ncbi:MAG TPA: hypothetical protein VNQ73_00825 [Ilumatobacter sp.]|nr:hypothetical protein [Ilumatobacter sp.]